MPATVQIVDLGDAFPWPKATDYTGSKPVWFETREEHYWYGLEVLPPLYFKGGFFVGEPASSDRRGVAIHSAFVKIGPRYFVRDLPIDSTPAALAELRAALEEPAPV